MARKEYDTYILTDLSLVREDQETEMILRDLTPSDRRYKYCGFFASTMVSRDESKYPDKLWIRLGRGQLQDKPWSVKIIKEVNKFR